MGTNAVAGYSASTNTGQWNIPALFGPNAASVLKQFNGKGVKVAVYDDGLDKSVLANMTNYDASRELVIGGVKADPYNLGGGGQGVHGTATFGIIGADAAQTDGKLTGIAYGATMTAVNVFNGAASGSGMLNAIGQMKNFDVTSNSWGWTGKWADFADVSGSFGQQLIANLTSSATVGRGGLGTVIVKSAGNDWFTDHRDANTQEFNADRHVLVVGAVGQNGDVSYYSQRGASVLVSAYSNGGGAAILTTDRTGAAGYDAGNTTNTFGGTSAAAPEVAAITADMLGANSKLGVRDVENILAMSARDTQSSTFGLAKAGNEEYGWGISKANTWNGGGYHFSNDVGFGTVDGRAAIREAEVYSWFGPAQTYGNEVSLTATAAGKAVPASGGASFQFNVLGNMTVEDVSLSLSVTTKNLDNMKVVLTDPYGNKSIMLDTSTTLAGETGNSVTNRTWTLGSHAFQGEVPTGTWTATVTDANAADGLVVNSAKLGIYTAPPARFRTCSTTRTRRSRCCRSTRPHDPQGPGPVGLVARHRDDVGQHRARPAQRRYLDRQRAGIRQDRRRHQGRQRTLGDGMAQVTGNDDANIIVGGTARTSCGAAAATTPSSRAGAAARCTAAPGPTRSSSTTSASGARRSPTSAGGRPDRPAASARACRADLRPAGQHGHGRRLRQPRRRHPGHRRDPAPRLGLPVRS